MSADRTAADAALKLGELLRSGRLDHEGLAALLVEELGPIRAHDLAGRLGDAAREASGDVGQRAAVERRCREAYAVLAKHFTLAGEPEED